MTEAIVNYLNLKLETVGRLGVIHCLAELRSDGTTTVPYVYSGTGQVVPINIDGGNLSYWRMDNPISFEPIVGKYGVNQMSGTYDLRLVVVARRKDSTVDDAFMPTRLAEDIANQITGSFPDLKLLLKAQSVSIRVNSIDTNIPKIWGEEFTGTQVNDLNYTRAIMALSVSVTVIGSRDCWQNECEIDPNILHIFDFCNPNVVAELTPSQVACLEDALCEPCADVTIDINGVPFDTIPSGGTLDIPVLDTASNPVGSQIGTDWVIGNNATYINSVQVTDQEAEQNAFIAVELDGNPSGTWNAGTQTWEVTSDPCLDGNIELNGVPVATVASGGTEDIPVLSEGSNPVGSLVGSDWVIENNATTINGVQVTDQEAEQDAAIFVTRDGVQNGTWNAGIQTWEVTSAACSPVTFQINAVNKESLSSGSTFNLITKLDGAVNSGSYDALTDTLSFTSAACSPVALQINGTPQESIAAGATFNLIATLDGVAGGTYTPATDTLAFTSNSGWVRDSNWPVLPTLTAADEAFYGVVAVFENAYNQVAVAITNLSANIAWGDGTSVVSNGSQQIKVYDYTTIAATVYTFQGRNVKYVTLGITRVGGAIVSVNFYATTTVNQRGGNNFLDINCSMPNATTFTLSYSQNNALKGMQLLQRLQVWQRPLAHYAGEFLRGMNSLQVLLYPFSRVLNGADFSITSTRIIDVGDVDWGTATTINNAFNNSGIQKHGNLTANSATSAIAYFVDNIRLTQVGTINLPVATSLTRFFGDAVGSTILTTVGLITAPLVTNLSQMCARCFQLGGLKFSNCALVTNTTGMLAICPSFYFLLMPNLTRGVDFTNTAMGNYGMNIFASGDGILNGIGTASGAQTITITGTPFGALVTASDATALAIRAVMTGKGYTIAN